MDRVIAYIDGFNLYYGLRSKRWKRYYWLNIQLLARNLLKQGQKLVCTKYFTSRVSSSPRDPEKNKRQTTYLEALETLSDFQVFYGHYLQKQVRCWSCGRIWEDPDEKMTDVNIAVELMVDAFRDNFDTALLISGDSDLSGAIGAIHNLFAPKRVVVGLPPARFSKRLQQMADAYFVVGRKKLADSQFPNEVQKSDGYVLCRPDKWR